MEPIEVIINAGGGRFIEDETENSINRAFADNGLEINLHLAKDGSEIESLAVRAAAGDSDKVVAGGGDGTLNAVAARIAAVGKVFGVLPLGTLNHFSKDLGIPQDLAGAVGVIKAGHTRRIDLGEILGHGLARHGHAVAV